MKWGSKVLGPAINESAKVNENLSNRDKTFVSSNMER